YGCAKLEFLPFRHQVRLHYNAPPDLLVTRVRAVNVARPDAEILYSLHEVHNFEYFRVESTTGNVYTKDYVYLRIGNNLTIMVVAYDQEEAIVKQVEIRITEYNRQRPAFVYDIYRTEISFVEDLNVTLLQVHANDNDSVHYNADLYYTLLPGNWTEYFQIDIRTGEIQLSHKLTSNIKSIRLNILVEDGGSPVQNNTAIVEITVKSITEPRRVRHTNPMSQSVDICWDRPRVGNVTGYLVRFRETGASQEDVRDLNVTARNTTRVGSGLCTKLKGLKPWTDYEYRIYAWNKEEVGLGSEVSSFATRSNYCSHHPCRNGRCVPTISNPGFRCDCEEGYYGTTCNHFNPCVNNPCGEYGECKNVSDNMYNCQCMDGFSGINCSVFDPCLARPSPCANGATCVSTAPNTYQCSCAAGYYGSSCKSYNWCASNPCVNGGTCVNLTDINYQCVCPEGFAGKSCDVDIDDCISSPCANGAHCTDKPNGFSCVCLSGFTGESCTDIAYCLEGRTQTQYGVFQWPKSRVNETKSAVCPYGSYDRKHDMHLFAYRSCKFENHQAVWSFVNASNCATEGFNIAMNVTTQLSHLTSLPKSLNSSQISTTANHIDRVYNYALHDKKIAGGMLSVISNMLDVDENIFDNVNDSEQITDRLIDVVKKYTSKVSLDEGKSITFRSENLVIEAINLKNDPKLMASSSQRHLNTKGVTFFGNRKNFIKNKTNNFEAVDEIADNMRVEAADKADDPDDMAAIVIPDEALDLAKIQTSEGVRLQFISFKNAKFFRRKNKSQTYPNDPWQPVIIANIANATISNLTRPVTYKIPTSPNKFYYCAFWDEIEKKWSQDGISTNQSGNFTWCYSSHLTAFSVLFDPDPNEQLDMKNKIALSIVSYVGCALSIIGLILTIITYSIFRCLNRDRSGKILLCLCVAMLLMNISFLLGSQSYNTHFIDLCVGVAVLTHYFLLATLAWMCVEAINMYQMLIYVFASSETHFMLKRSLAAWGIPLIFVGTTAAINIGYYHSKNEYCILSADNPYVYYTTFLGPCCIILLINCVVFILVTRVLFQPRLTGQACRKDKNVTFAQVRGAFTVMTLLGVTWVFGALAVGPAKVPFQYIFCILNSLQGFIIFIVRCIQYPEARWAWKQLMRTGTLKKYRGVANFSGSSNSQCNGKEANDHSATSRTLSGATTSTTIEKDKDRKLSIASLTQFFKGGVQRRRSSATTTKKKDEDDGRAKEVTPEVEVAENKGAKDEKETQWHHYCCSMDDFRKEIEAKTPVDAPALNGLGSEELPFIEDENPQRQPNQEHSLDQGYSSLENSPNSSRILPESIADKSESEMDGKMDNGKKESRPNDEEEEFDDSVDVADASQQTDEDEIEKMSLTVDKMTSCIDDDLGHPVYYKASTANNIFELIEDTIETVKNMLDQLKLELPESENKIKEDLPGSKDLSGTKIKQEIPGDMTKENLPERKAMEVSLCSTCGCSSGVKNGGASVTAIDLTANRQRSPLQ
uniref:Uncharacterized protein n=1 Tax=Strigamia maritima TaxID=126957 RepID=T1IQ43_STRMM